MTADNEGRPWDWGDDDGDVIVAEQPPVACYLNPKGAVVLRQPAAEHDEDDAVIWFGPEPARAIAAAILHVAGYEVAGLEAAGLDAADIAERAPEPAQDATKPMAGTSASRQKRYRQRKKKDPAPEPALFDRNDRNAVTPEDRNAVTDTVTETVTPTVTRDGGEA